MVKKNVAYAMGDSFPLDTNGRPTSYLAYMVLKAAFVEPSRWFTAADFAKLLAASETDTKALCKDFRTVELFFEDDSSPGRYRYNLECPHSELQVAFEKFLVDVEYDSIPVHLTLDYSPSFPYPTGSTLHRSI